MDVERGLGCDWEMRTTIINTTTSPPTGRSRQKLNKFNVLQSFEYKRKRRTYTISKWRSLSTGHRIKNGWLALAKGLKLCPHHSISFKEWKLSVMRGTAATIMILSRNMMKITKARAAVRARCWRPLAQTGSEHGFWIKSTPEGFFASVLWIPSSFFYWIKDFEDESSSIFSWD